MSAFGSFSLDVYQQGNEAAAIIRRLVMGGVLISVAEAARILRPAHPLGQSVDYYIRTGGLEVIQVHRERLLWRWQVEQVAQQIHYAGGYSARTAKVLRAQALELHQEASHEPEKS